MNEGIVQHPHKVLRGTAKPVALSDIGGEVLKGYIKKMKDYLAQEEDGVAIAAPQIGIPLRIFVISKKVLKNTEDDLVCINPEIIRLGKKKIEVSEGCLSVRWKYGTIKRSETATIKALNESGNEFVLSGRRLLAQIFQHETDHLNGILFIDSAKNIEDLPPQK